MASSSIVTSTACSPRSTIVRRSDAGSAPSLNTRVRDSSAEMTSNEGFSVVAPISVTVPSSTCGSTASCCALLKRWISSMKSTVGRPSCRRCRASATTRRRSATPAVTADRLSKWPETLRARTRASVVLPEPGGPQSTMLGRWPAEMRRPSTDTSSSWPSTSSSRSGRRRAARGVSVPISAAGRGSPDRVPLVRRPAPGRVDPGVSNPLARRDGASGISGGGKRSGWSATPCSLRASR